MRDSLWRVAVIDSGIGPQANVPVREARRFEDLDGKILAGAAQPDGAGHGTTITRIIASAERPVDLLIGQVLDGHGRCTAAAVAAAVEWALSGGAQLVHLSLGLRADRAVLAEAIARAVRSGALVVCASPARGAPVFPAAYPGVLRATGDARCGRDEIAALGTREADFGACVTTDLPGSNTARGASIGAAHVSRIILSHLEAGSSLATVRTILAARAAFRGPERHAADAARAL
ncbi:MAG: subtilisin-like serine protease QhpE [Steroidobacteraceae bacterium]